MLFSVGLEARTHRGVIALIGEHFVKPSTLSPELGRLRSRMQRDREDADYVGGAVFIETEVSEMIEDANRFLSVAESQLEL